MAEPLLRVGAMLSGDVDTGRTIPTDTGFQKLGYASGAPPKTLKRILGARGSQQARNLFK